MNSHEATLSEKHRLTLTVESGISETVIAARGYRTVTDAEELRRLGFAPAQCRPPGLLLPLWTTDGGNGHYVFRSDNPRVVEDRKAPRLADGTYRQRVIKYEQPQGEPVRVDCPPPARPRLADPAVALFITEGQKKADALVSRGACAIALTGVWNFKGKNEFGGTTFLADFDYIALNGRQVFIVFDSDVVSKQPVRQAMERLTEHLKRKSAVVNVIYLPQTDDGKTGVDDWLVQTGKGLDELIALAEGPRPEPRAAEPMVELLDAAPLEMTRPLMLLGDAAYAAIWPFVRVTRTESVDRKSGKIIRHDPPLVEQARRLLVVDSAGVVYGDGGDRPQSELPFTVTLGEIPAATKLMSTPALKAYRAGQRPDPAAVFGRVVDVIDRFIDFDRSLADQRTMAEMVACYTMATYMLSGLSVASNLWPNGDRGSGKTQLLAVICEMAYLGQLVLAGGSFAALRDLADYGATLGFDDAENLSDPKKTDPDKRTLLLAGNRRGNTVPLKEPTPDGRWRTRHISTFSFRLFSAIRLPDNVLASRTIVVPLIRTADRGRANADPMVFSEWPHDRQQLVDDLWGLALAHLPEIPALEQEVNRRAQLVGRNLEPWRSILTVALLLEQSGVGGLFARLEALSVAYQAERPNVESGDLTTLVIRALVKVVRDADGRTGADSADSKSSADSKKEGYLVHTKTVTDACHAIAEAEESEINLERLTSPRVGRVLSTMRFSRYRDGHSASRSWLIKPHDLKRWALTYSIATGDLFEPATPVSAVSTGSTVSSVSNQWPSLTEGEL